MTVSYSATTVANPEGAQGSYPLAQTKGHEGMLADLQAYVSRSYRNETGAVVPFGHLLIQNGSGTVDASGKLLAGASATDVIGVAIDSNTFTIDADAKTADGRVGYKDKATMNVLTLVCCTSLVPTPLQWATPSAFSTPLPLLLQATVAEWAVSARPLKPVRPSR